MAAFLEGKLAPGEVAEVAAHLRECADCRTVTGEAARFEEEEKRLTTESPRPQRARWWVAAAAAAGAIVASVPLLRPATPIATLIDASPAGYRKVHGRLSGFPWAELRGSQRSGTPSPAEHELTSAANTVLGRTIDDQAVDARHAAGVAHLLIDQTSASLEKLASAAGDSKDARIWNDLAAARYTVAVREDRRELFPAALAAVNRALQLDPKLADARFNRALILEQLHPGEAREEWKHYLQLDPSSGWSNEARRHLRDLERPHSNLDIPKELARAAGDRRTLADLVRRFPQESRTAGERHWLGEWADAVLANDAARAEEKLALVRAVAEELAAANGERLLLDTIQALERMPDRRAFAAAYRIYHDARAVFWKRDDLETAEKNLRRAVAALRAAGSPLVAAAEYHAAQCAFDNNRPADSTAALLALRARLSPGHHALAGDIDLGLARNANASADWGASRHYAARALATFTALGETESVAFANAYETIPLERMGAVDLAWQRRMQTLGTLRDPHRAAMTLQSGALALAAADRIDEAIAVMDVAAAYKSRLETHVAILIDRARFAERTGDLTAARRLLGEARTEAVALSPKVREAREAQLDLADAVLRRASDPRGAIAALDASIAFYERLDHGIRLPDAYLQRARAHRALGRPDAALADYTAALRAIAEQQEKVSKESLSLEFLDVAAQTIDETIDLRLERGETAEAFAVTDRAHALAGSGYVMAAVPEGTAVIEYAVLPRSLVIFCLTSDGIRAARVPIERGVLAARVASFVRNLRGGADVRKEAAALYAVLIGPVAQNVAAARELVIIPDRQLHALPFLALHDGSQYLIQKLPVRIAPSAAADRRTWSAVRPARNAVVIADPASDRAGRLPFSREEAGAIARIHDAATLQGRDATRARVSEAIVSSAIVHYAGHADSNAGSYGALMLAPEGSDSGLLSAGEIARLELRARPLVVLSACGTLRGSTSHVAGMPSLARAFLGAGARTVVGTLWEIDDDMSHLFIEFHERLRAGEVPADALRSAQLAMLQSSDLRWSHPSSWSAVEVLSNL